MNTAENIVREFWLLMATNDFASVKQVLAEKFVLEWPQTNELIRGPENFARMNSEYPAQGSWNFNIKQLVASSTDVVTHVAVTDGTQAVEAISFFQVAGDKVIRLVEYWPESYAPPTNRSHLTEPLHTFAASAVQPPGQTDKLLRALQARPERSGYLKL